MKYRQLVATLTALMAAGQDPKHPLVPYLRLKSKEMRRELTPESASKYVPHQGRRECLRRQRQQGC